MNEAIENNDILKKFNGLNVSSKFGICGMPIRVDTYKTCSFGCTYCFSNFRKVMEFKKELQVADIDKIEKTILKVESGNFDKSNFLYKLISQGITWHCGGMSDPFQPIEKELNITKDLVDVSNKHNIHILYSTKSDSVYNCNIKPENASFQLSVTNVSNNKAIEPNVPDIENRLLFFKQLKTNGFNVGIRIQPFIPNISTIEIVKMFEGADHFILEGIKLVPQNNTQKNYMMNICGLKKDAFTQMGLLNLQPEIRLAMYQPFIDYFESHNISYSIADNDLHNMGNNFCCCGDKLVRKSTTFNTTYLFHKYGLYTEQDALNEIYRNDIGECKCANLFTSNRQNGKDIVENYFKKELTSASNYTNPNNSIIVEKSLWE